MTSTPPARSGEEIQAALSAFVARWADYEGGEREEAQSFLNELIDCYGVERRAAGMRFEYHVPGVGFMDMFWPGRALVEMKAPSRSQTLEDAQPQAERYWRSSTTPDGSYGAVRYVVLCSFHRLLIGICTGIPPARRRTSLSISSQITTRRCCSSPVVAPSHRSSSTTAR